MEYTKEQKLSILSEMIQLAQSDKKLKERELNFINAVANSLGITKAEVQELIERPAPKKVLEGEPDRILQFHRLVLVMNIDEQTSLEEISALKNLGLHLGLPAEAIDEVFHRMGDYPNKVIPPDVLMDIFKRFYN